jgi:hypothetical protein
MAFLTLNGTTVPVKSNALGQKNNEHRLDRDRMFDGTMRVIRGGQAGVYGAGVYRQFDVTTGLLSSSTADAIEALVNGDSIPLAMSGDAIDNLPISVIPVPGTRSRVQSGGGVVKHQLQFTLHETPAALPADTSATIFFAALRGRGYWQDLSRTVAAGDGDQVQVWDDQSGNDRHLHVGTVFAGPHEIPMRDGDTVRFGTSELLDGPNTTLLLEIDTPAGSYAALSAAEMMISFRLTTYPPASAIQSGTWGLERAGANGSLITTATGHLLESAFLDSGGGDHDFGVPPTDPSADLIVYSVGANGVGGSERYVITWNNVIIYDDPTFILSNGFWVDGTPSIGHVSNGGDKYLVGIVRDVVLNTGVFTDSQRRSWYDYMRGATSDPPLP